MQSVYPRRVPVPGNLTAVTGWTVASQESVLSLIVVLGSSVSLVGLIFAFITYRYANPHDIPTDTIHVPDVAIKNRS